LQRGALVTAERLLARAHDLAPVDAPLRTATAEGLAEALALAAKLDGALAVGAEALDRLTAAGAPDARRAELHLVLARAADAATRWSIAEDHLAAARVAAGSGNPRLLARVDALAAHVAIGDHRLAAAEELAERVLAAASELGLPDVECEALEVLGRRERLRDLRRAAGHFERAHATAARHGLTLWSIRALHELGTIDMFETSSPDRMQEAGTLAYRAGALSVAATVDLQPTGL
jgi:hypothetical protein